jgi:heptosyltransferase III
MLPPEETAVPDPRPVKKILIIHSGGIGDMLLALPALRILRQNFPHASLDLMGRPERLSVIAHDLRAESLLRIDRAGMAYFYVEGAPLPPDLSAYFAGIDILLLFAEDRPLARNLRRAGVNRIVQIPPFPQPGSRISISAYYIAELKKAGVTGEDAFSPLRLPESVKGFAREFWARHDVREGSRVLAIHPGSGSRAKNWDAGNFAAVADWAGTLAEVLLIFGPAEEGDDEIRRIAKRTRPIFADRLPLLDLAGLLVECSAYLGNDSGITHLAGMTGIPTVAVFGPTDPVVWGPAGPNVRIVREENGGKVQRARAIGIRSEHIIAILAPYLNR